MSAVSPVSTTVSSMNADRHAPRHDARRRRAAEAAEATDPVPEEPAPARSASPATESVPLHGNFAASLLAERLQLLELNLRAMRATSGEWRAPPSDLSLRNRTV